MRHDRGQEPAGQGGGAGSPFRQSSEWYATRQAASIGSPSDAMFLKFTPDGFFRIEDVPGGKYRLTIDLRELRRQGPEPLPSHCLAQPGRYGADSPEVRATRRVILVSSPWFHGLSWRHGSRLHCHKPGWQDGETVRFQGKYVLLNFWAVSNAALWPKCRA